jgi:alpha-L-rhamnosidase
MGSFAIGAVPAPAGLICDLLEFPERTALKNIPTFGWMVKGGKPGDAQKAYRILVASSEARIEAGQGDLWDSGRVDSVESINVLYEGAPLTRGVGYYWSVCTWFGDGCQSPWSVPQRFVLAMEESGERVSVYPVEAHGMLPASVHCVEDGVCFVDFGKDSFGWLEINTDGLERDTTVTVRLGEKLKEGRIDREPGGTIRFASVSFTLKSGTGFQRVELSADLRNTGCDPGIPDCRLAIRLPKEMGVVLPFRYVEIEGLDSRFSAGTAVRFQRVQYPFNEAAAFFESSDARLNAVWGLCKHTILATSFTGYYVDGDRERIPYEADAYINQLSHYAVDREYSMARRTHEHLLVHPTWPTEWKQHSILMAWADYVATGDSRSLARCYEVLKREKLLLEYAREDGLLDTHALRDIVDWPLGERDSYEFLPVNTVINAFHYRTLVLMGRIAKALGFMEDERDFSARSIRLKERFNSILFDPGSQCYRDGEGSRHSSLHANLFPLAFDLVPEDWKKSVIAFIKSRGMACSVYPAQYLLEGLFRAGEAGYAIELMRSEGLRSWCNMVEKGSGMAWEAWDQSFKPNQDWNHAWGTAPANIISRYVLGVYPLEPGYGKVRIRPQLGPLSFVEGIVPTIRGPVHVRAWRDAATLEIRSEVEIPANMVRVD